MRNRQLFKQKRRKIRVFYYRAYAKYGNVFPTQGFGVFASKVVNTERTRQQLYGFRVSANANIRYDSNVASTRHRRDTYATPCALCSHRRQSVRNPYGHDRNLLPNDYRIFKTNFARCSRYFVPFDRQNKSLYLYVIQYRGRYYQWAIVLVNITYK